MIVYDVDVLLPETFLVVLEGWELLFFPSVPNWKHIFFFLGNLLRDRQEGREGWSEAKRKRERETDTEALKDILYSFPINLPHNIGYWKYFLLSAGAGVQVKSKPSRMKFSAYEKAFGRDSCVCQLCTICEHLVRCL